MGLIAWFGVIHSGTVSYDTDWLMRNNPVLSTGDLSWIPAIWTDFSINFRHVLGAEFLPVRDTDILIDFLLFGDNWALHHAGSLVWYLVGCSLFRSIARILIPNPAAAWAAAAVFCLHPIHTQNVAWLAGRKDLLGLVFFLAAWRIWLLRSRSGRSTALAFLFFIAGVWSKNTTVVLPAVLLLTDILLHAQSPFRRWKHWTLWGATALPLILLSTSLGKRMRLFGEPHFDGIGNGVALQLQLWALDLKRLMWPDQLAIAYPTPTKPSFLHLLGLSLLVGGLLVLAWKARRRLPVLSLGIGIFFLAGLPTTAFNQLQNLSADRYLLLPSLGFALVAGASIEALLRRGRPQLVLLLGLVLPLFIWRAHHESRAWRSELDLWSTASAAQPQVLNNWTGHARALRSEERTEEAVALLQGVQERFKGEALYHQSLGALYLHQKELASAEASYREALQINPQLRISGNDLAVILSRTGRLQEALPIAEKVTRFHPGYAKGFNTYGALLLDARQLEDAENALLQAESLDYENASTACNLGGVYYLKLQQDPNQRPAAEWWWTQCKRRNPSATVPPDIQLAL
ncbi:MAG: hypothetical protein VXW32_05630 [Myxococcota bacterium]|nr:hypothetical protein [Myxococcota bacterium]